jgi:hypothetical protein
MLDEYNLVARSLFSRIWISSKSYTFLVLIQTFVVLIKLFLIVRKLTYFRINFHATLFLPALRNAPKSIREKQ